MSYFEHLGPYLVERIVDRNYSLSLAFKHLLREESKSKVESVDINDLDSIIASGYLDLIRKNRHLFLEHHIIETIRRRDLAVFQLLIVYKHHAYNRTILAHIVANDCHNMTKYVHYSGEGILMGAVMKRDEEAISEYINPNTQHAALTAASMIGDVPMMKRFIEMGAVLTPRIVRLTIKSEVVDAIDFVFKNREVEKEYIIEALSTGNIEIIDYIVNSELALPHDIVIDDPSIELIEYLLKIDKFSLHYIKINAIIHERVDILELLKGVCRIEVNEGILLFSHNPEILKLLIEDDTDLLMYNALIGNESETMRLMNDELVEEVLHFVILSGNLQLVKRFEKGLVYNHLSNAIDDHRIFEYILTRIDVTREDIYDVIEESRDNIKIDVDVAKLVLDTGADVIDLLFSRALNTGNKELLEYLLESHYEDITEFINEPLIDNVRLLVESGFVDYDSIVEDGYNNDDLEIMEYGLELGGRIEFDEEDIDDPIILQLLREYE